MILIYSKDVDEFVNIVIDCLSQEYVKIGETDPIYIGSMDFSDSSSSYKVTSTFFENIDFHKIKSIWFNGGCVSINGSEYENKLMNIFHFYILISLFSTTPI